jgi:hypothetical protein
VTKVRDDRYHQVVEPCTNKSVTLMHESRAYSQSGHNPSLISLHFFARSGPLVVTHFGNRVIVSNVTHVVTRLVCKDSVATKANVGSDIVLIEIW